MEIMENNELDQEIEKRERFGLCEICSEIKAKYTCPKCELHTCSLACSKNHKKELECDGIRDKTKYIPLKKMTPLDFMNDYYFLEEATRFTKQIKSNEKVTVVKRLQPKFPILKKAAIKRNVKLFFLNDGLLKRKQNYSKYDKIKDEITWQIHFIFPNTDFKTNKRFNENVKIQDMVKTLLDAYENEKQLDFYRAQGANKIRVLLKTEGLKNNSNRFYDLDLNQTLKTCLSKKVIIEYPTLYIVFDYLIDNFDTVDSDDEFIEQEQKLFLKTLHEEVFSRKVGQNPMLVVRPEEIPVIGQIIEEEMEKKEQARLKNHYQHKPSQNHHNNHEVKDTPQKNETDDNDDCSDNEIAPENYFFTT